MRCKFSTGFLAGLGLIGSGFFPVGLANSNVHVTRFWHNHQPIYWPEWNSGTGQDLRVQYAHDSIRLKPTQNYGAPWNHPHNDLEQIFGLPDRIAAYQGRPRDSVSTLGPAGGMAMSYTGSLIDNIRNLSANSWNYGGDWNSGNTQARQWTTSRGGPRLDLVGFSYHHSLTPLLPREVLRKEIQIFKEAWWKAWGGNPDKSDHSKGFFPTEMAFSRDIIDVLADEGYGWVFVASHHISRTSPSYNGRVTPENFQIKSSPPNRADQLGPRIDNPDQWWFAEPNPGQAAWNAAPFAYQLHRVEYVNPETGDVKSLIAVPSDDVLSYQAGYSGAQIGLVDSEIAPWANDPDRPVLVVPATDGDNAWGGGYDSWMVSTPAFFGEAENRGYSINSVQDFVNEFGPNAPTTHIEEGAWIYPEMCYGSPYFLKWIEPPVRSSASSPTVYPDTIIDVENGWSLKFFAYAPKMAGANWVITAEQILRGEGGDVQPWKIQAPYDWDGAWTEPNDVELAWHIYLKGLDSGFQYYGGLGNDDEVKPGLAARRAIETLQSYMSTRLDLDETGPTVLKPQRFPYNPGGHTFGWFNSVPEADTSFLKKHPSEFYIWTLAHDVSGIESLTLKLRHTHENAEFRNGHHQNLTYAGGPRVSDWVSLPMTRRVLPNTRTELNALAGHGEIDFVVTSPEIADHYFLRIDDTLYPDFRGRYFDYYIEAVDSRGNVTRTEIQHVFVEDDGSETPPPGEPSFELGQAEDPMGYLLSPSTMRIFAAVRGTLLYVATWTPHGGDNDHFLFITDELLPAATAPAPWAKTGFTAHPPEKPYLAGESVHTFSGWVNTNDSGQTFRAASAGGRLEGVIDLEAVFGSVPERLFLAAAAYQTEDGGGLTAQGPAGNDDGNLDPGEFLEIPLHTIRDSAFTGVYDLLDPARGFRADVLTESSNTWSLGWPAVPGRSYTVYRAAALSGEHAGWAEIFTWTAPSGADRGSVPIGIPDQAPAAFFRMEVQP